MQETDLEQFCCQRDRTDGGVVDTNSEFRAVRSEITRIQEDLQIKDTGMELGIEIMQQELREQEEEFEVFQAQVKADIAALQEQLRRVQADLDSL
jgi:hypothetical protein